MWLSRVCSRGCVRMRRIFSGLRTVTGWDHPFSAYTGVLPTRDAYMKPIYPVGPQFPRHLPDTLYTDTVRLSTYKSNIQDTNSG